MKKIFLFVFCTLLLSLGGQAAYAQKKKKGGTNDKANDKKEIQEWKKRMKNVDPLKFKQMNDDLADLRGQSTGMTAQLESMKKEEQQLRSLLERKSAEVEQLSARIKDMEENCTPSGNSGANNDDYTKGVVYKVQVGNFRDKNLSKFLQEGQFWMQDPDGAKKYTIAYFRDYWEADSFKKVLQGLGVKDAWIVAYENNQRKDAGQVSTGEDNE